MNQGPFIFVGIFFTMALSWYGFVFKPTLDLGRQAPVKLDGVVQLYPGDRPGLAQQGAEIYRANGCVVCHTQQARDAKDGSDKARGWGQRLTVAQDYLFDNPPQLGQVRVGPDLANFGTRSPDLKSQLLHLYAPRALVKASVMPPYPYLFQQRKLGAHPSPDALALSGKFAPPAGFEIVPTSQAYSLLAYLFSLRADVSLYEAPIPKPPTNGVAQAVEVIAPAVK